MLHDAWFDIEKIKFEASEKTMTILFASDQKTLLAGDGDVVLTIQNIKSYTIEDSEKVRFYDLFKIEWDDKINSLKIICNIPLKLELFRA